MRFLSRFRAICRDYPSYGLAVAVLAAGLTVCGVTFNVEDAILFRPLPVPTRERLFRIEHAESGMPWMVTAEQARRLAGVVTTEVEAVAGVRLDPCDIRADGRASLRSCATVTPGFFQMVGLDLPLTDEPGVDPAVISHGFWMDVMRGRPDVVGSVISGSGDFDVDTFERKHRPLVVVAVAPRGFHVPGNADIWHLPAVSMWRMGNLELWVLARRSARGLESSTLGAIGGGLSSSPGDPVLARPLEDALTPKEAWPVLVLVSIAGGTLLVGWLAASALLGSRSGSDSEDAWIKHCLGASRRHFVAEASSEAMVLALASWSISQPAIATLTRQVATLAPFLEFRHVSHGAMGMVVTLAVSLVGAALYAAVGVVSALATTGREPLASSVPVLAPANRLRVVVLAGVYGLAIAFLYTTALLALSYDRTYNRDFGFDTRGLLALDVVFSPVHDWEKTLTAAERLLQTSPAIESFARLTIVPSPARISAVARDGQTREVQAWRRRGGPGLFRMLGVPLLMGTDLPAAPADSTPGAVVVDRTLADALWPGENALGRILTDRGQAYEVVGVTADFVDDHLRLEGAAHLFVASATTWSFVARTNAVPERVLANLLDTLTRVEPGVRVNGFTYQERRRRLSQNEAASARFAVMVVIAAVTACIFVLYAALHEVTRRRRTSAAVHLALGARPYQAFRFLASRLVAAAMLGSVLGLVAGLAAARVVAQVVPRVESIEPLGIAVCLATMVLSASLAIVGPLRLVTRTDVAQLLRLGV